MCRRCLWRTGVWMGWRRLRWNRGGTLSTWIGFGQEDEMVSRWRCDRWWAFLGRAETSRVGGGVPSRGCRPGGAVGVPRGRRGPHGCEPSPGRLSRRDARDRFDRAVPSLRRRRRRWGSAATVSPAGTTGRLSSGVIKGVSRVSGGCVGGTGLTSIDNASRRVATGRWLPPSSSNTKRRLPRRAALRRSLSPLGLETLSRIATSQEFRCLFMV